MLQYLYKKSFFLYCSQFHNLHVNSTVIHNVNEDLMSDMLSQHQNWYIQRNLCLGHSKFPTAIEAVITFFFFFFQSIILINPASWCGVYSRPAFINISVPKFSVYSNKYDVEGFPAQRKATTSHEEKMRYFPRVIDIANQLLRRLSPFALLGQVYE